MSDDGSDLVPYTDVLRQECPRVRILVVGKSGVGKSALINAVFGIDVTAVSHKTCGVHDVNTPLTYPSNDRIIIHDSQGFEAGEKDNVQAILDFIDRRCNMPTHADRLHAIWVCAEIPFAGARLFEVGVERILKENRNAVPIIVVFTKLDLLRECVESKIEKEQGDLDDDEFEKQVDGALDKAVEDRCVRPLCALMSSDVPIYPWVATSTKQHEPRFEQGMRDLVDRALELTKVEDVWIQMAIAQRSNAQASIDASIRIGRKQYWRGLLSDIFVGFSMRKVTKVLHRDIINVWNMKDPNGHLLQPEFIALLSVLVEDLSDEKINNYTWTERASQAALDHPTSVIVSVPAAVIIFFAEWIRGAYRKTRNTLRCLVAFIVDLTLTLDILFYLVVSHPGPMTIKLINKALLIYKDRKAPVHASIKAWADLWGTFSHMDADAAVNKIKETLRRYCVKPEEWKMIHATTDETWISVDVLRET